MAVKHLNLKSIFVTLLYVFCVLQFLSSYSYAQSGTALILKDAMVSAGFHPETAEVVEKPDNLIDVALDEAEKIMRLIDTLEDLDDVQEVYTNADFSDEVMQQLTSSL